MWWQQGVIYQIYPRSFQDSNGDGVGDLNGIISRLEYLKNLGIDVIWLSPIFPSPMADFGYDVSNYTDIHPLFGTLADFDRLVQEAHQRDLRIIIDFVPNHTSEEHPWFIESRSSRDNPKRDWYFWKDAKPDGSLPNNWLSNFGGPSWEWDAATGQYYLHSFLKEQPDLNWRNPAVKAAMLDSLRFWLERGVDGFRIDVAHYIMKDPTLSDNPPNPGSSFKAMGEYTTQLHINDQAHPDVHKAFREIRALLDSYSAERPRFSVGEIHIMDFQQWATYYGAQLDELHMPFNFSLLFAHWNPQDIRRVIDGIDEAVPEGGWPNYVLGNHDEHRVASRWGAESARAAMMLLLTLRGTPTLYYGDELGMQDGIIPPEMEQDPWGKLVKGLGVGRDPERTPMQWDSGANVGFCPAGVQPWLPVSGNFHQINAADEQADAHSMLSFTRRLLSLRRATPALHSGRYRSLEQENPHCFVYERTDNQERWLVALNLSGETQTLNLEANASGSIILSTFMDREGEVNSGSFELRPHEGCLIRHG